MMKKLITEFKTFISRGNVIDMAVGIIIGTSFTAIINSAVNDLFMPLFSFLTSGFDYSSLSVRLGDYEGSPIIYYGAFISAVINFLLISIIIFFFIKAVNKFRAKKDEDMPASTRNCDFCKTEIPLEAVRCPNCTSTLEIG